MREAPRGHVDYLDRTWLPDLLRGERSGQFGHPTPGASEVSVRSRDLVGPLTCSRVLLGPYDRRGR